MVTCMRWSGRTKRKDHGKEGLRAEVKAALTAHAWRALSIECTRQIPKGGKQVLRADGRFLFFVLFCF